MMLSTSHVLIGHLYILFGETAIRIAKFKKIGLSFYNRAIIILFIFET